MKLCKHEYTPYAPRINPDLGGRCWKCGKIKINRKMLSDTLEVIAALIKE
jgi:hypothetical protein